MKQVLIYFRTVLEKTKKSKFEKSKICYNKNFKCLDYSHKSRKN